MMLKTMHGVIAHTLVVMEGNADVMRPRQNAACPKKAVAGYFIKVEARSTDQV